MSEVEDKASQGITSTSETALTCGGYRGDGDEWRSIRGTLTTRGSGNMPLCRSVYV